MPKKRSPGDGGLYYIKGRNLWRGTVELGVDADGKRRQRFVTARTQRACKDKLDALKKEIIEHGSPLDKVASVAEWAPRWLEDQVKPHAKPNTYTTYASMVNRWIVPVLGRKKVASLKPSDVLAVRKAIRDAGRGDSTAYQAYRALSLMLEAARVEGLCRRNVAEDVKPPKRKPQEGEALPIEDSRRILEVAATMPLGTMWWFKLLGGPRQGEVLGARLEDLDLDGATYTVNWALDEIAREHGCGEKVDGAWPCGYKQAARCPEARWRVPDGFEMHHIKGRLCLIRPKSNTGRVIPLIPEMVEALRRHIAATADVPNPHGLIWRNADGTPLLPVQEGRQWRELLHGAGLIGPDQLAAGTNPIRGHWARHTTITVLAELGVDFQIIGEIVGHSSAEVTKIYRHSRQAERFGAIDKLGGVLVRGVPVKAIER